MFQLEVELLYSITVLYCDVTCLRGALEALATEVLRRGVRAGWRPISSANLAPTVFAVIAAVGPREALIEHALVINL